MASTKPRKNVEAGLYAGGAKTTFKTKDEHENQDPGDQHAPGYCPDVPMSRRSADAHGLNPAFDSDEPRKAPKSTGGGGNCEKSPFSAAGKNFK